MSPPVALADGNWLTRDVPGFARSGDGPVLVLLGDGGADLWAEIPTDAAPGTRVYLLVGPGWGRDQVDSRVLQAPRVLVRRIPEVPATAVHVGTSARLWLGGGFFLGLDENQRQALRQTFLRLFWHEATEEAWSGGREFGWRPARERPFDVPDIPASASLRWEPPDARLASDAPGALVHVTSGLPPVAPPRRLWFPAGPKHHGGLSQLVRAGVEVVWEDRGLPDLVVGGDTGEALFPGTRGRLRLRLTAVQATEVGRLLETDAAWRFQANVRLGDAGHRSSTFWLPDESAARGIETEQLVGVPDVLATSLREVPDTVPTSLPAAQPLARSVRYQWTVVPPRAPGDTEEDALVSQWRKLDEAWTDRLARVRKAVVDADADRGRIGRAFSQLVGAMLGFERTQGGLLTRIAELETRLPSRAGPADASAMLTQLAEVERAAQRLQADLEESEHKAGEDEDCRKQQAGWQARVHAANGDLPDRRSALTTAENRRTSVSEDLRKTEADLRSARNESKKDLTARRNKLSDDLRCAEKELTRLRGEVATLEQQAAASFEFRPTTAPGGRPAQPTGRFVPPSPSTRPGPNVPDEALPEVGSLRSQKGQRYLAIQSWEELTAGELAASRLSARLVAPETE